MNGCRLKMTLPELIVSTNLNEYGIFNDIVKKYDVSDPISANIITTKSSEVTKGNFKGAILHKPKNRFQVCDPNGGWIQIGFPKRELKMVGYGFKGDSDGCNRYQWEWNLYGFNEGEESNPEKWVLIQQNNAKEQNYCWAQGGGCIKNSYSIYPINNQEKSTFTYFRWVTISDSSSLESKGEYFLANELEVYGSLSVIKNVVKYTKNYNNYFRMFFPLICIIVIVCL